jgi:hypothetical protein
VCPALFGMLATGDLTAVATDWLPIDRSPAAAAGGEREIRMGGAPSLFTHCVSAGCMIVSVDS